MRLRYMPASDARDDMAMTAEKQAADQMRRDVLYPCHMCGGSVSVEAVERYEEAKRAGDVFIRYNLHCGRPTCPRFASDSDLMAAAMAYHRSQILSHGVKPNPTP